MKFKRYCKTLTLKNDPELIRDYKKVHSKGSIWPEITKGMKDVGILDMEIYIFGNHLFMIMDTVIEFDHNRDMKLLASKPRQSEWESYVSTFQGVSKNATAEEKWQLMDRMFEMNQKEDYKAEDWQLEEIKSQK